MASSSMSPASGSFGRLLKSSKVVSQFDPSIPLVYTTHGGSKKRSDYGLKRALPKITTAAIRVHSLDNSMTKLTDFSYAAREHCFVQGFRESNVKISGPATSDAARSIEEQRSRLKAVGQSLGGCAWDKKNFQSISELKKKSNSGNPPEYVKQNAATLSERSKQGFEALYSSTPSAQPSDTPSAEQSLQFPEDYLHMSEADFQKFLTRLQKLRPKFVEYLRVRTATTEKSPRQVQHVMLKEAQAAANHLGIIDDFLAHEMPALKPGSKDVLHHDPRLNNVQPSEHIAMGLTYAAPNLYMSDQAIRTLPARKIDNGHGDAKTRSFNHASGHPVAALGLVSHTKIHEAPDNATVWHIDKAGEYNIDYGRGNARVEDAYIRQNAQRTKAPSPDETLYGVEVDEIDNPSKRPTILDEDVVKVKLYKAGEGQGSLRPKRVGSQEWVTVSPERPTMEESMRNRDLSAFHNSRITPPRDGLFRRDSHIPNRKSKISDNSGTDELIKRLLQFAPSSSAQKK